MSMIDMLREIGPLLAADNLAQVAGSEDVIKKIGMSMPMPDNNVKQRVRKLAKWLLEYKKQKYMFLSPEISLIEEMVKQSDMAMEFIIAVPCDLDQDTRDRLKNNLPHEATVSLLEEPFFPQQFFPGNGILIISGYLAGDRAMVLPDTYRMVEHYSSFMGKTVFIPYQELEAAIRYDGWQEIRQQRITEKWRYEL